MSVPLNVAGVVFNYPEPGDSDWATEATNWAVAVTAQLLTKAGGTYQLTAELDWGTLFGLKSLYYKSRTANPASAGQVRLARADTLKWRNQANSADLSLGVNSSNQLTYEGVPLGTSQVTVSDTSTIDLTLIGVDLTADVIAGSLSNSHIASGAAIAYSKLALTGAILNADLAGSIAYSKLALSDSIVNADVNAAAAIAYSKLALTGSIVNADVNASAAIAYSKLALTGSIVNADVSASAAIAYSKLALAGSIVNADVNASAAIAYSKLALTGAILNADLAGSIAYSKLALTGSIVNADIGAAAAIAYSKLALTGSIVNADIGAAAAIAYSKLALTGSIVNADVSASAAIAYSKLNLATSIVNADVSASAAIAYSKLNLATSIVNADISTSAAIALSKLAALTTSRAVQTNASTGALEVSSVTNTELGYLSGVTSAIQTQINAISGGGLTLLNTYSPSSAASVDITSQISSTYDVYLIVFSALRPASDSVTLQLRTDTSNGASFDSSAGNYGYSAALTQAGSVTSQGNASATQMVITGSVGNATNEGTSGEILLISRGSASIYPQFKWNVHFIDGSTGIDGNFGTGSRLSAATIDAVQLLFSSGNIASGTVWIYGLKKS